MSEQPEALGTLNQPEASAQPEVSAAVDASHSRVTAAPPRPTNATEWHHALRVVLASLLGLLGFTGVLLMTAYSPSIAAAWGSVWYIETQMAWGWLIRGLHRFSSDALIILAPIYLAFLLITRLHRGANYARWWAGLILLFGGMGAALTGYLLPWDQHGYWGMTVRLNILARLPWIGESLRSLLVGGSELGALSLTRFYTLHVLVIPALLAWVTAWWLRRETGWNQSESECHCAAPNKSRSQLRQNRTDRLRLRAAIGWLVVFVLILGATVYAHWFADTPPMTAPADSSAVDYPARPEWFNLFLFQWLKYFEGPSAELIGSVAVPGGVLILLALIPWIDRGSRWRIDRYFAVLICVAVLFGSIWLTAGAVWGDARPRDTLVAAARTRQAEGGPLSKDHDSALRTALFHKQLARANERAHRAIELADAQGIPPEGPLPLLANDPTTRGPELFAAHCASCHRYDGHDGLGEIPVEKATSSDLAGFATRTWIRTFLANPMSPQHFGLMKKPDGEPAHTRMVEWLTEMRTGMNDDEMRAAFEQDLEAVAAYLESETLDPGRFAESSGVSDNESIGSDTDTESTALIRKGRAYFLSTCNECHSYRGERSGTFRAPEMFGYGSVDWIEWMIRAPDDESLYRSRGREPAQMPSFKDRLSERERRLLATWLHDSRNMASAKATENAEKKGGS